MRSVILFLILVITANSPVICDQGTIKVSRAVAFAQGKPLPSKKSSGLRARRVFRGFENLFTNTTGPHFFQVSPVTETPPVSFSNGAPMPPPELSFDGISNRDNADIYSLLIIPPDMVGAVGSEHYVQVVNSLFQVFGKDGSAVSPALTFRSLFEPLGTVCSTRIDGLPNVIYDQFADRWLISQVCSAFPPFRQMVAISKTGDATGEYYLYEFAMPNVKINDFPKFGLWCDAYYMTTDEFLGSDYVGAGVFAFEREKLLAGEPTARYVYTNVPVPVQPRRKGMLPADIDGLRQPSTGAPAILASYTATEYGDAADTIRLFEFSPNFDDPAATTFVELPESPIPVEAFDPTSPEGRADIAQPPPGEFLDSQSDRLSHRLSYRNFGSHESLVVTKTVRTSPNDLPYQAGVRVYEFRRSGGAFGPAFQGTVGDATSSRWISSAALDHQGNLAIHYNFVSSEKKPSIYYTGRTVNDATNTLRDEATLVDGTGVQKAFGFRWGEYSAMTPDPVDDCTFWFTNPYYTLESQEFSDLGWLTRIGKFKFDECLSAPRAGITGIVTDASTGAPIANAVLTADQFRRTTNTSGSYGNMMVLPDSYEIVARASGYRTQTVTVNVVNGEILTANFALVPVPVLVVEASEIVKESCPLNPSPQPGESLTLSLTVRNDGARNAGALTGTLVADDVVIDPGPAQVFGPVEIGESVTRSFTFSLISGAECGSQFRPTIALSDGDESLGEITVPLRIGLESVAFSENFDSVSASALPAGWTTSASEEHQLWRTSSQRSQTKPNALFSPAPLQRGVNEVTSPSFSIDRPAAEIRFRLWYALETTFLRNRLYDGAVMEISVGDGEWQDILTAGGSFLTGGYDGTIDGCCQNPLAGRLGWSGRSGINQTSEWIDSAAKLPASAAGQDVRLRWRVGTDIGGFREGIYIDDLVVADGYSCECEPATASSAPFDFDGDGRTDLALYSFNDTSDLPDFRILESSSDQVRNVFFGSPGDISTAADFDGDGKADIAVFRPSTGTWYILRSGDGAVTIFQFGRAGDVPTAADFDGDGNADVAVFRPDSGVWYVFRSSDGQISIVRFGLSGDIPVPGDFDGDGKSDIAVFRPSDGIWYILRSGDGGGVTFTQFGFSGDRPVAADFDGDGRTDSVVYRPSTGIWYILGSTEGFSAAEFGSAGDIPLRADIDGDGRADIGVYRPSAGTWYFIRSSDGRALVTEFGHLGERPVPEASAVP